MSEEATDPPSRRSWLERIGLSLGSEPRNRDELIRVLRDAQQRELLDSDALAMMEGVLQVAEMRVRDVMIPRAQMVVIGLDWPLERLLATVVESGHSRLPVIDDDRDDIIGILIVKDLLRYFAEGGGELALRDLLRPAKFIPESKRLNSLLKEFRSTRLHMAIVVDEYGGVAGLVTIEDVLEQIVGEIDDEHDDSDDDDDIRALGGRTYQISALTPVEDFNSYFDTDFSDDKADTIGGLVMMQFGHLPKRGEVIQVDDYRFRVLRADSRRIHLLELTLPPPERDTASTED
ncbi:MAG: transporter associated domain-containing protein [Candidatus Competibacterales bacterium]|nr:transporter associated domain-containing protein [Candidatus Competibacterales bacterium]